MSNNPSYVAEADLAPSIIVKMGAGDHGILPAGAGDQGVGVVHEGTREAPIPGITPLAAKEGETVRVYGEDETCDVVAGGVLTVDAYVKPDASGHAIAASGNDHYIGRVKAAAAAGEMARIQVMSGFLPGT